MTQEANSLKIFIAAPVDVSRERALALRVLEQINQTSLETIGLSFEPLRWENLPPVIQPTVSEDRVQTLVNSLVDSCQVFVLILYRRYGSVTPGTVKSHTEREVEHVLRKIDSQENVYLLCYFRELGFNADPGAQEQRVLAFKKALIKKGIAHRAFKDSDEFENQIRSDLYRVLFEVLGRQRRASGDSQTTAAPISPTGIQRTPTAPVVFVSYSHDDDTHVRWVNMLATNLVENGVDIRLDLWDLHPGDDVADFMEKGVFESDRVLVICTPQYVARSDNPKGGVGYEKTIITGEIVRNIGTNKFIPILRRVDGEQLLPRCLSSRLYIDFRDGNHYGISLQKLLRELHGHPEFHKPKLGSNPFV